MLDLRAKLLQAGLVTKAQVQKVEQEKTAKKEKRPVFKNNAVSFEEKQRQKALQELKNAAKGEQYEIIRRWVVNTRLDNPNTVSEQAQKFYFENHDGQMTWLTLEPTLHDKINTGEAGIMTFMSNYGLANCVVPKDIIEDVAQVFPAWVRNLKNS